MLITSTQVFLECPTVKVKNFKTCSCFDIDFGNSVAHSLAGIIIKLLLHPIVRVYTRKCAANIVEKY